MTILFFLSRIEKGGLVSQSNRSMVSYAVFYFTLTTHFGIQISHSNYYVSEFCVLAYILNFFRETFYFIIFVYMALGYIKFPVCCLQLQSHYPLRVQYEIDTIIRYFLSENNNYAVPVLAVIIPRKIYFIISYSLLSCTQPSCFTESQNVNIESVQFTDSLIHFFSLVHAGQVHVPIFMSISEIVTVPLDDDLIFVVVQEFYLMTT